MLPTDVTIEHPHGREGYEPTCIDKAFKEWPKLHLISVFLKSVLFGPPRRAEALNKRNHSKNTCAHHD